MMSEKDERLVREFMAQAAKEEHRTMKFGIIIAAATLFVLVLVGFLFGVLVGLVFG